MFKVVAGLAGFIVMYVIVRLLAPNKIHVKNGMPKMPIAPAPPPIKIQDLKPHFPGTEEELLYVFTKHAQWETMIKKWDRMSQS